MMRHKIEQTINLLLNVVMGIVLGISGQVMQGICAPLSFIQTFCLTMGVGFLLGTYIPAEKIGQTFASLFGLKKGIGNYLVSTRPGPICRWRGWGRPPPAGGCAHG